jgi:PKD repeat protein
MANEGTSARDTINYEDLIKKSAWIFIEGGYTKIVVNPDGTFSQPEAEGRALTVAASGNIIDTLRIAANQVNLTSGYRLNAQALPGITLPAGDYALAAISMDGDRTGALAAMPFTVMETSQTGTVPASVERGTSFTASFPAEAERLGVVVIRNATWNAQVGINASILGVNSLHANLTYNGVPATKKLYHNVYASPDAAAYAYARNASSVSIPTDSLLAGTYDVHMVAVSENGTVQVYGYHQMMVQNPSAPVANFTASPMTGFAPLTVAFADISTGSINSRLWDFGDGTTSTVQNPTHVFNAVGTYTVNLTVTGYGGSTTMSKQIAVLSPVPVANFTATPTSGAAPLNVAFADLSTGNVTAWLWDFGDGTNSTVQNPTHVFNAIGTYTVNLTVTGPAGTDTVSTVITAFAVPVANFTATPTSGTVPLNVAFADLSTGNVTAWLWDFGDGTTSTVQNPTHVFNAVGTYTVNLTVTGPGGSTYAHTVISVRQQSGGGGGGGGGHSSPVVVPPPASGASALSIFTSFTLPGATFGTSGNAQTLSLDLGTAKGAKVSGDTITLEQDGLTYVIKVSGISRNGDIVTGTVTDVTVKITPMTGTFNRTGGATASFVAHFPSYPTGAHLSATLDEKPVEDVVSAYSLALRNGGLDVGEVAYTLTVKKTGIEATGPATITMAIDTAWVTAHGGVNEMRIVRQADDGTTEVLETVFRGYNAAGQYVFEAQSPNGLSVIGLVAVTAASSVPATTTTVPAAETTAPTGETTTPAGEGGFPLLPTLVILVIVIALVAVGYRFMKQN